MEEKEESLAVCPHCGYVEGTPPKEIYHIVPGTILHEKYIVGRVLGYGGFGITYIGWDYTLDRKVAIKEFLPSDFATRMPGETLVTVYNGEATVQFEAGLERFIEETWQYLHDHPATSFFIFGHRHIELDLMLSRQARLLILGEWIRKYTYAVWDGESMLLDNSEL